MAKMTFKIDVILNDKLYHYYHFLISAIVHWHQSYVQNSGIDKLEKN